MKYTLHREETDNIYGFVATLSISALMQQQSFAALTAVKQLAQNTLEKDLQN